ncbi:MAG: hypothetical protein K2X97_08795 [Mycobacteriaceae bacterium]|nr:hypothetical protein [Mycobacteriaceae bacterium]
MSEDQPAVPDVDRLARSMLMLHGDHHDHDERHATDSGGGSWSKSRDFGDDPQRAAAVAEASRADRERYLTAGLHPVDCRFCHITVSVRWLGPGHTAVQWNTEASERCAHFAEVRACGGNTARTKSCPRLSDSIDHAVAEGILEREPAE